MLLFSNDSGELLRKCVQQSNDLIPNFRHKFLVEYLGISMTLVIKIIVSKFLIRKNPDIVFMPNFFCKTTNPYFIFAFSQR